MLCIRPIHIKGQKELVPCGQCCLCREQYAKQWAVRASLENRLHDKSVFLTLTYDPLFLPKDGSVHKRVLQLFLKRLRKYCKCKIRYFACGEYGEQNRRPHYHLIVYGIDRHNPVFYGFLGKSGYCRCWSDPDTGTPYGRVFVGDVTFDSCKYVAGYVAKKYKGKGALAYYQKLGVEPEFCLQSRRPGIGGAYFDKYQDILFNKGFITISGKKYDIPKYFEDKRRESDWQYDFKRKIEVAKSQFEEEQKLRDLYADRNEYVQGGFNRMQLDILNQKQANFEARHKKRKKGALDV